MVRLIARVAVAAGLAAAVAAPFTQSALAGTLPTAPSLPLPQLPAPLNQLVPLPVAAPTTAPTTSSSTSSSTDPSSSAEGDALNLPGLNTCIGCSNGTSSTPPSSSQANATGVKVLGINLASGSASGDQTSTGGLIGTNPGDAIALPLSPLVTLAVADWFAKATSAPSTFERAALLDLNVNPDGSPATQSALYPLAYLAVLEGQSATSADCATGGGASASSNGARLGLGNNPDGTSALAVILLHNGASTTNASQNVAYLASINGNTIGTNSQVPQHTITIPGLLSINLLVAPNPSCGTTPPAGCVTNCSGNQGCPPGVLSIELPPGTCLGTGVTANSGGTTGNGGTPGTGVQAATTGSTGTGVPSTGIALGILGFLLLGGGLIAMAASRFARRWRRLA